MTKCVHCRVLRTGAQGPGSHHAADCPMYRSEFRGPHAEFWEKQCRLLFEWWALFR
jgi:hypothetical protein